MTDSDELRIGTAEREDAVRLLGEHMSEGRLALEEYEERTAAALEARTRGDLKPLFRDLPAPFPAFMTPPPAALRAAPAPYYPAPPAVVPYESDRYRVAAGVLQIVLPFGIGRFYTGHTGIGLAQLLTSFVGIGVIWSFIDGIIILAGGGTDADGRRLRT
ncbi:DUF1707 domain-containing protein [Actinophytocola sp. KF-1]